MRALILAAGRGTRMRGLCDAIPKPMLPLAGRPFLVHLLDALADAGVNEAHIVVGHLSDRIRDYFAENPHPLNPRFIEQENPNGTGSAALLGAEALEDGPFLLAFGDIVVSRGVYADVVRRMSGGCDAVLTTRRVPDPCHGAAVYVKDGLVDRIIEKPAPGTSTTDLDNAGIFCFPPEIFRYLRALKPSPRGEYELTDAIDAMLADGLRIAAEEARGFWFNLTDPEALLRADCAVLKESDARSFFNYTDCEIDYPVVIGDGCRVERVKLGPCVSIGADCELEDNCAVSHSIVMPGARIGRGATVEYAIISPGASVSESEVLRGGPDNVTVR